MEFSRQNTGEGSHYLLQGIFPTQRSNPGLPHCRQILYQLSHQGSHKSSVCPTDAVGHLPLLSADLPGKQSGFIHPSIHSSIHPTNYLLSIHIVVVHFKCLLHTGCVLGSDKTGLTTIEEFEDKSAHVANM